MMKATGFESFRTMEKDGAEYIYIGEIDLDWVLDAFRHRCCCFHKHVTFFATFLKHVIAETTEAYFTSVNKHVSVEKCNLQSLDQRLHLLLPKSSLNLSETQKGIVSFCVWVLCSETGIDWI